MFHSMLIVRCYPSAAAHCQYNKAADRSILMNVRINGDIIKYRPISTLRHFKQFIVCFVYISRPIVARLLFDSRQIVADWKRGYGWSHFFY